MEHLSACLACGAPSDDAPVVHRRRDDALVRCRRCRLVFANPQYTPEELVGLYRELYYDEQKNFDTDYRERDRLALQPLNRVVARDLLRRYPRLRPSPGREVRVLDFGSGVGFFLEVCRDEGLAPLGLDFSEVAARYGKERLGIDIRPDPERALAALPDAHFRLITAWQVVEHLRDPRRILRELVRVLAPGGVLAVAVPNLRCWRYRLEGARWFNIQNLTHLAFFDVDNLSHLFGELGLERIVRPALWGGRTRTNVAIDAAQFLARLANVGNEFRLYAEKPGTSDS